MSAVEERRALGRYRILRPLGRGGMGVIHLARVEGAAGFSRPVAVKRVVPDRADDPSTLRLFVREARILAQLNHPNIVNVIDFGEEAGDYVMVLEYVRGYNLGAWHRYLLAQQRNVPFEQCIYILGSVLDALDYAHTFRRADGTPTPVIHRDVSPANVLLDARGNVKLLDFGIARIEGAGEYRTSDGALKGKFPFTAPEVFAGAETTEQSDVYSAGVLLYLLLTNVSPFRAADAKATVARVLTHEPDPPSALNPAVPAALDAVVARALAKDPAARFASAAAFASELRAVSLRAPSDVRGDLAVTLEADFTGSMPEQLGLVRLDVLDEAVTEPVGDHQVEVLEGDITVVEPLKPRSSLPPPRPGVGRGLLLLAVLALVGIGGVLALRLLPQPPAQVIVIQKESAGAPAVPSVLPPLPSREAEPPPGLPEQAAPAHAPAPVKARAVASPTGSLTEAFRARQPAVESCFTRHADGVEGAPRITLRFEIDTTGGVTAAQVLPSALGGTPLGGCLLDVARTTRFGSQSEAVTFSIPITARRVP
jgi:serine/threonine protein kinase